MSDVVPGIFENKSSWDEFEEFPGPEGRQSQSGIISAELKESYF